ncbi:MAG: dephospho-CoA kinase [Saprospiraceae bacterium]
MTTKRIGITGGIGSGKTTVCRIFEVLGIPVYYADDRAKWLMQHSLPCDSN